MIDYKALYEQQRSENEVKQRRITELESKQKILERSFRKIFRLREELRFLQEDAETRNKAIQDKVSEVIVSQEISDDALEIVRVEAEAEPPSRLVASIPPTIPDGLGFELPPPALPQVVYDWDERSLGNSYRFMTRSRFYSPGKVDELRLNLQFRVNSCRLPDKIQLEIRDQSGRVVFQKRQNIYYIKLQERISVLDANANYTLEVKTVKDETEANETVAIRPKHFKPDPVRPVQRDVPLAKQPCSTFDLRLAQEEFVQVVDCLEEVAPIEVECLTPPASEAVPKRVSGLDRAKRHSCVVLKRPQPPILRRKGPIPMVQYMWQKGFRKGPDGVYTKVPILRISAQFPESNDILPIELDFHVEAERVQKFARILQRQSTCEFQLEDTRDFAVEMRNSRRFPEYESFFMPLTFQVRGRSAQDAPPVEEWCEVSFCPPDE